MSKKLQVKWTEVDNKEQIAELTGIFYDSHGNRFCRVKQTRPKREFDVPANIVHLHNPRPELVRALELRDEIATATSQARAMRKIANDPLPKHKEAKHELLAEKAHNKVNTLAAELDELSLKKLTEPEIKLLST